jgi:hypothetical protein
MKAIYKFNNGNIAKLCNGCNVILRQGIELTKEDMKFKKKNIEFCLDCLTELNNMKKEKNI